MIHSPTWRHEFSLNFFSFLYLFSLHFLFIHRCVCVCVFCLLNDWRIYFVIAVTLLVILTHLMNIRVFFLNTALLKKNQKNFSLSNSHSFCTCCLFDWLIDLYVWWTIESNCWSSFRIVQYAVTTKTAEQMTGTNRFGYYNNLLLLYISFILHLG